MSEVETDHEPDRIDNTCGTDNDLTTDGAISLFTSALNNALDRQKATLITNDTYQADPSSTDKRTDRIKNIENPNRHK
jgi:hypothetical protein